MSRFLKILVTLLVFCFGGEKVSAFSLIGPIMPYQTALEDFSNYGEDYGPNERGQEYRWNVPFVTYGFEQSFIEYFGTNGIVSIEEAFKILNNLPPVSQISDQILSNNFGFFAIEQNATALNLGLVDIKSVALGNALNFAGLFYPESYVWAPRSRDVYSANNQTFTNYVVVQRNYDPIYPHSPTAVINGVSYDFEIAITAQGDTLEVTPALYTTAASGATGIGESFYGLTFDDAGGLRYIYGTNNYNVETMLSSVSLGAGSAGPGSGSGAWSIPIGVGGAPIGSGVWNGYGPSTGTNINGGVTNVFLGVNQAARGGIDRITYLRVNFDSLLGQGFVALTNTFQDLYVTNGVIRQQTVRRAIVSPDILFRVSDLGFEPGPPPSVPRSLRVWIRDPIQNYSINISPDALADGDTGPNGPEHFVNGPGVIQPWHSVSYSSVYPWFYIQAGPGDPGTISQETIRAWASFDGNTADPVIYPQWMGLTVAELEKLIKASQNRP